MKKLFSTMVVLIMVLSSVSVCFAAVVPPEEVVSPDYVGVSLYFCEFEIDEDGVASFEARVKPKTESMVDRVTVSVTVKNSIGSVVFSQSYNAAWSSAFQMYIAEDSFEVPARGIYTCNITLKPYLDNHLLETITADPIMRGY